MESISSEVWCVFYILHCVQRRPFLNCVLQQQQRPDRNFNYPWRNSFDQESISAFSVCGIIESTCCDQIWITQTIDWRRKEFTWRRFKIPVRVINRWVQLQSFTYIRWMLLWFSLRIHIFPSISSSSSPPSLVLHSSCCVIKRVIIPQSTDRYLLLCVHTYDMCWSLSFSGSICTRLHSPTTFLLRAYIKKIYDRNNWSQDIKYSILVLLLTWRFSVNLLCEVASECEREKQDRFSLIWYNKPFASVQKHEGIWRRFPIVHSEEFLRSRDFSVARCILHFLLYSSYAHTRNDR